MPLETKSLGDKTAGAETRSQSGDPSLENGDREAPGGGSGDPQKPTKPDWLVDDKYFDPEKGIKPEFGEHYNELLTARQAETDRLAKLPAAAEAYELKIPDDLQLPDGVTAEHLAVAENDPHFQELRNTLFEGKVDPEIGQKIYAIAVKKQIAEVGAINARVAEEQKKLGPNYAQRVAAIGAFLEGRIGKPLAASLLQTVLTSDHVKGLEQLAAQYSGQGAAKIPSKGAEPNDQPGKIEGWDKMTFEEKRAQQAARAAG